MDRGEFEAWRRYNIAHRGQWVTDPIHSTAQNYLAFRPHRMDETRGSYWMVYERPEPTNAPSKVLVQAGMFYDAFPHIGEADFHPLLTATWLRGAEDAVEFVKQQMEML